MSLLNLGKITLPPTPRPSPTLEEYTRNVGIWTREVEQTFRNIERALQDVEANFATKSDLNNISTGGGGSGEPGPRGLPGRDGVDGIQGPPGADGSDWHTGAGGPSPGTGVNGDNYLNTTNGDLYLKVAGTWTANGNIRGPTGPSGSGSPAPFVGAQLFASVLGSVTSGPIHSFSTGFRELYDTGSMIGAGSPGTLPGTITVQTSGYYLVQASATIGLSSVGGRTLYIGTSGTAIDAYGSTNHAPGSGLSAGLHCSNTVFLSALTPVIVRVSQTSGSSLSLSNVWLTVALLGT